MNTGAPAAYFQFPLCSLRVLIDHPKAGLSYIVDYCCVEQGNRRWFGLSKQEQAQWAQRLHVTYEPDLKAAIGASDLGLENVTRPGLVEVRQGHHALERLIVRFEQKHGRDARVRIRSDIMRDACLGKLAPKDFCVLCGIYSKIGDKRLVRITRREIYRRANACRSDTVFGSEGPVDPTLTFYRVVRAIDRLHQRGFFARATFGRRQTYYSHRLDADALRAVVVTLKTNRVKKQHQQRVLDADMTLQIEQMRRQLHSSLPHYNRNL